MRFITIVTLLLLNFLCTAQNQERNFLEERVGFYNDPEKKIKELKSEEKFLEYFYRTELSVLSQDTSSIILYADSTLSLLELPANEFEHLIKLSAYINKKLYLGDKTDTLDIALEKIQDQNKASKLLWARLKLLQDSIKGSEILLNQTLDDSTTTIKEKIFALEIYSDLFLKKRNKKGAYQSILSAIRFSENEYFPFKEMFQMVHVLVSTNKYKQAIKYLDTISSQDVLIYRKIALIRKYDLSFLSGDYKLALNTYKEIDRLNDSLTISELLTSSNIATGQFQTENEKLQAIIRGKENSIEILENKIKYWKYGVIGLGIILLIMIWLLLRKPIIIETSDKETKNKERALAVKNTVKPPFPNVESKPLKATTEPEKLPIEMQPVLKTVIQPVIKEKKQVEKEFYFESGSANIKPEIFKTGYSTYIISGHFQKSEAEIEELKGKLVSGWKPILDSEKDFSLIELREDGVEVHSSDEKDLLYIMRAKGLKGLKINGKQVLPVAEGNEGFIYEVMEAGRQNTRTSDTKHVDRFDGDVYFLVRFEVPISKEIRTRIIEIIRTSRYSEMASIHQKLIQHKDELNPNSVSVLGLNF